LWHWQIYGKLRTLGSSAPPKQKISKQIQSGYRQFSNSKEKFDLFVLNWNQCERLDAGEDLQISKEWGLQIEIFFIQVWKTTVVCPDHLVREG
jgi:hypothetical protein